MTVTKTQATVRGWVPDTGGSAYLHDGKVVFLPPSCLKQSPFRFLRSGQRVVLHRDEHDVVVRVSLV